MFKPSGIQAVPPKPSPIFPKPSADTTIVSYVEDFKAVNDTTKAAILGIIKCVLGKVEENSLLGKNCASMFDFGAAKALREKLDAELSAEENMTEDEKLIYRGTAQEDAAVQWICDLVNASKKKELDGKNVESYFSSLGRTDVKGSPIASLINRMANFLPDMVNEKEFREGLTVGVWTKYHASRVSTGKLLYDIRGAFTDLGLYMKNDEVDRAIIESAEAPYDVSLSLKIPTLIVGYASIFYEVSGKDIGKWYQGIKGEDEIPAAKIKSIKLIFKKYLELTSKTKDIDKAESVEQLRSSVGEDFW